MGLLSNCVNVLVRLRYPVSLPEHVAYALGIQLSNLVTFQGLVERLCSGHYTAAKLQRYMRREQAEAAFHYAVRKERFARKSLYSFYFRSGWLEFVLEFDNSNHLRRVYIMHKDLPCSGPEGVEIPLAKAAVDCQSEGKMSSSLFLS